MKLLPLIFILMSAIFLSACATNPYKDHAVTNSPATLSYLQQGQRYFDNGYFKSAMQTLLPLACDGNAEAQYAVGYMYYYGYGVPQDTDVGYFWISRSASQQFEPAIKALDLIKRGKNTELKLGSHASKA